MVIRVEGVDGSVAWINAEDVRLILPATSKADRQLPTKDAKTGVALIRPPAEIKATVVAWNTPGVEPIVIGGNPDDFAQRVNEALRAGCSGPVYDIPAAPLGPSDVAGER